MKHRNVSAWCKRISLFCDERFVREYSEFVDVGKLFGC